MNKIKLNTIGTPIGGGGNSGNGGGKELTRNDVNFFDYDGTLLYAYTWEEAKNLTELPSAPSHDGMTFKEWNYNLEDIKEQEGICIMVDGLFLRYLKKISVGETLYEMYGASIYDADEYGAGVFLLTETPKVGDRGVWGVTENGQFVVDTNEYEVEDVSFVKGKADVGAIFYDNDGYKVDAPANVLMWERGIQEIPTGMSGLFTVVSIPNTVETLWSDTFEYAHFSHEVKIPSGVYFVADHYMAFNQCYVSAYWQNGELFFADIISGQLACPYRIQEGTKEVYNFMEHFSYGYIVYPKGVSYIGKLSADYRYSYVISDFSALEEIPWLDATHNMGTHLIIVPDNLYDEWINSTNWTTYSEFIVKASEYNFNLK